MTLEFTCRYRYDSGFQLDAAFRVGGHVTALFGPSGSGKTTIVQLVAGLLRPGDGTIRVGDRTLVDVARRIWLAPERRRLGVVFQDNLLFPHRSVRGNLRYGVPRGAPSRGHFERVVEVLELEPLLDRLPHTLSGGQQRRVALGRALLREPDLLLLDEPLIGLEAPLQDRILTYLERVTRQWQVPTLLVSHEQLPIRRLAEYTVVLNQGRVVDEGPTPAALDRATLSDSAPPTA